MLRPGTLINERYEIIEKVGSGGMADVYKAKCHTLNRYVALKVLKSEFSDDRDFVNRFRDEAQACAGLSHPNIVNIYDVGDEEDIHFIVMELVEGITLKDYIERKGKLEIKESVGITIQIARGMEVAHANNIVHRDIKPQNIILSKEGKVKVTDFGIAKAINTNTINADVVGSVHYISPEQARGGYSDEKSDIYSLGVTMYEMLSGRVPFVGDNNVSVALLHIQSEPIPLRELDPDIPVSIERIVQKSMQKKPERRYLSATELISDLRKAVENPNGNFVVIPNADDLYSPTITISDDELNYIKNVSSQPNTNGTYMDIDTKEDMNYNKQDQENNEEEYSIEEDAEVVDPRMEKIALVGTIAAAIIAGIVVLFLISKFFNLFPSSTEQPSKEPDITITPEPTEEETEAPTELETYSMPYVLNLTLDDATAQIEQRSEEISITSTEDYSDNVERGLVIEQYPSEGTEINSETHVRLVVSAGQEAFPLPNVRNYGEQQAVTVLTDAELKVVRDYRNDSEISEGNVVETLPQANSLVVKGDTITVIVSRGPEVIHVRMPTLVGLDENAARNLITASGLSAGTTSRDYSDEPEGTVILQSREPDEEVREGTAINLVISKGPEQVSVPNLIGQTEGEAKSSLERNGLSVGKIDKKYSDKAEGTVIGQSIEAGEKVDKGTSVNLTVSQGPEETEETEATEATEETEATEATESTEPPE